MLKMSIFVGDASKNVDKRVLYSHQFHVRYGEPFVLKFQEGDREPFQLKFSQKIESPDIGFWDGLLPSRTPAPKLEVDESRGKGELNYILENFNKTKVTTNLIPFYAKEPYGHYYFQLSAMSISSEVNNNETIWLYTVTIYEED